MSHHPLPALLGRINMKAQLLSPRGVPAMAQLFQTTPEILAPESGFSEVVANPGTSMIMPGSAMGDREDSRQFEFTPETGIARIPIEGILVHRLGLLDPWFGMTGYDGIETKFLAAISDPEVEGILLDIDSPGGEVYGVEGVVDAIFEARGAKPIWALINERASSAAYWLASAAHVVVAPASADTGSIGALVMHVSAKGAMDAAGYKVTLIYAGDHKVDGHPFDKLPENVRVDLQAEVEDIRVRFATSVARNRNILVETVLGTEARVLPAADALAADLIDKISPKNEMKRKFAALLGRPQPAALPRKP